MKCYIFKFSLYILGCTLISCAKFIDIDPPKEFLTKETVFKGDESATSAVTGIYSAMAINPGYASGGSASITSIAGTSSDELVGYSSNLLEFYENEISTVNSDLSNSLYSTPYKIIYVANTILEALENSNQVTPPVKAQLRGEALFVRAFTYFYLVNMYGAVPLHLVTDYRITQIASRTAQSDVYKQILADLTYSESLLSDVYPSAGRVRPNKSAAQALLARTYLYLGDWENAEKYSSLVIGKTSTYSLVNFDAIFLVDSKEAIWQLFPTAGTNAQDGLLFIPGSLTTKPTFVSLESNFVLSTFEPNDKRQQSWIKSYKVGSVTYYYPVKYKTRAAASPIEYSMVLRLAEQYLIRAEARINQGKIDIGISDLNTIRQRPVNGVNTNILTPLLTTLSKNEALLAVEQERKAELFCEWGHRWFDLKRTGRVNAIVGKIKPNWQSTDELYPIPYDETVRNKNIIQNLGY
uniref:RagB/SusD family nutrient uptake outer membrane protein n=1 Tax=Pedobacter schmidteae TaxID=2201271 RepID=UPI000EB12BE4|nr:RagB/SusD family nutrient uptake outer membrane protein [Pedobacter schmidteae]